MFIGGLLSQNLFNSQSHIWRLVHLSGRFKQ